MNIYICINFLLVNDFLNRQYNYDANEALTIFRFTIPVKLLIFYENSDSHY